MTKNNGSFLKGDSRINRRGREKTYSREVILFIKDNFGAMSDGKLSMALNRRFNLNTTRQSVKSLRRYYGIVKGRRKYEPYPALTERTDRRGYVKIKNIAGKWVYKHTYLYEQAYGGVPEGYVVIFLDGKKNNFYLENLAVITRDEQLKLSKQGLRFNNALLTHTGINLIKLKNKIKTRGNECRK